MDVKVHWKESLTFSGTAGFGMTVPLGTEATVGGVRDGFRPMELIATGLAGCTAMDVISILQKKRQEITAFEVQVHAERATAHPKVFTHAVIEYLVTGHAVDEGAVVRSIELSATRYCPAQAMFQSVFPMTLKYHIFEAGEGDQRTLIKSGEYTLPEMEI